MNKKKKFLLILLGVIGFITILHVYALNVEHPENLINVTKTGEQSHGIYTLTVNDVNPDDVQADESVSKSNYIARIEVAADPGYYVENLTVKLNDVDLVLGFIAGSEHGAFFRRYNFNSFENLYEFFIPESTTEQNKVEVTINYAKKDKIDIYYQKYTGNKYNEENLFSFNNYNDEQLLVKDYMDGDIVLPEDMMTNGGLLKLQFTEENYAFFKGQDDSEINAEAVIFRDGYDERTLVTGAEACDDQTYACYVVVSKNFNEISRGRLRFGYNDIKIFVPNYVGFTAEGDVNNFNDQNLAVGFNPGNLEATIPELFYGTKVLSLFNEVPNEIINDNKTNNCGPILEFDDVEGSGYGYDATYDENIGTLTVNFSKFYQDKIMLELTILNNGENIFDDKVKININRFAFSGEILEVDEVGRNCVETDNNNTCDQGRYYSVQYRGVLSAFYVADNVSEDQLDSIMVVDSFNDDEVNLANWNQPERAYLRDKSFTPYALALFYDENGMILDTKSFDLNEEVLNEGYLTKASFNNYFANHTLNTIVDRDYIRFDYYHPLPISKLDYFSGIDNAAIMHQIVLMDKDQANAMGIKRISLFLVNGEITKDAIPSLTYGIGEGKVLEIRTEMPQPNNDNNGGNE